MSQPLTQWAGQTRGSFDRPGGSFAGPLTRVSRAHVCFCDVSRAATDICVYGTIVSVNVLRNGELFVWFCVPIS
jgi:hypothetical protein